MSKEKALQLTSNACKKIVVTHQLG